MGNAITLTLEAPGDYSPLLFLTMLQAGASDTVQRAAIAVFEAEEAGEDSTFKRRHYEACKAYQAEVSRTVKEAMNR